MMGCIFDHGRAYDPMAELVKWRQDKAPHFEGSFRANVIHGESQSGTAGPSRSGFDADPWIVMVETIPAECVNIAVGDTIELQGGDVLSVQQISRDPAVGWIIRCTTNARAPR